MKPTVSAPSAKTFDKRELVWLAGPEGAALIAVIVAIPYIISRLILINCEYRARAKADL